MIIQYNDVWMLLDEMKNEKFAELIPIFHLGGLVCMDFTAASKIAGLSQT